MWKNVVEPERPQTIWRMRVACLVSKATRAQEHARASATTPTPTHTHSRKHARMRKHALTDNFPARSHARTHKYTHTETCNTYCFSTATIVS